VWRFCDERDSISSKYIYIHEKSGLKIYLEKNFLHELWSRSQYWKIRKFAKEDVKNLSIRE